ncbi:MAG: hypothetical protein K2N84_00835 [Clostridia bacterium]|nr:hypothetical protein [Clostridia bacterium]
MKRIILILSSLLLIFTFSAPAPAAKASAAGERYAVAATHDVWFYEEANESKGLFILPYTYYVKVLNEGNPYCLVEYQDGTNGYKKITGYCLKDALTFVDFLPERPFLRKQINLAYTIAGGPSFGTGGLGSMERSVCFYGTYYAGTAQYYYVYADGVFDYVPATEPVNYDLNTDYLSSVSAVEPPVDEPAKEAGGLNALQIVVICMLCVAAVIAALFVLRGKKPPTLREEQRSDF